MTTRPGIVAVLSLSLLWPLGSGAQTVVVDEPSICFECHSDMDHQMRGRHVHEAFREGKCSRCHNPHASKHAGLLTSDQQTLCLSCHPGVRDEVSGVSAHPPAAEGDCVRCHDPHASAHAGQLRQELAGLCRGCHGQSDNWVKRSVVHPPVADGDCQSCHAAHGSSSGGLLNAAVPLLCFDCHDQDRAFTNAHKGHPIGGSDCSACHDPHAANLTGLVRENQHAPFAGGDCGTCHESSGAKPLAVKGDTKSLCLRCHRKVGAYEKTQYHHNLDDERSCANCHNPHASDAASLLIAEPKVLCMRCHFNEPGRKEKTFYLTHGGMTCTECHLPHGADNSDYLQTLDVELCARCHEAAHRVSHPVGPEVIDPRTEQPVTCLSCHQLHGASFEDYLPLSPEMDLCIQCHKQ